MNKLRLIFFCYVKHIKKRGYTCSAFHTRCGVSGYNYFYSMHDSTRMIVGGSFFTYWCKFIRTYITRQAKYLVRITNANYFISLSSIFLHPGVKIWMVKKLKWVRWLHTKWFHSHALPNYASQHYEAVPHRSPPRSILTRWRSGNNASLPAGWVQNGRNLSGTNLSTVLTTARYTTDMVTPAVLKIKCLK